MFNFKNKIDNNIKYLLLKDYYQNYRIIISYNSLPEKMCQRISILGGEVIFHLNYSKLICARLTKKAILRLLEYPMVDYIYLDEYIILSPLKSHNAPISSHSSGEKILGDPIGIGIIDTGVFPHKDLSLPRNKIKDFKDIVNNTHFPYDDSGHGTAISGVVSSYASFKKGFSQGSDIYMVKAFDLNNKGYLSSIIWGIEYLINISEDENIKVILLPFHILNSNEFVLEIFNSLFNNALEKDITVIVSAGDNGSFKDSQTGFSLLEGCISIGGFDNKLNCLYRESSGGNINILKPDFIAPCSHINSLNTDALYISQRDNKKLFPNPLKESYLSFSGVSLASAYVASLVCAILQKNKSLKRNDIVSLLKASCKLINSPKYLQGDGLINIETLWT